ncbi:16S rRNA (cytosine1402-N4)-methyltransferase [Williamsoniiplasma somnilux]|uniref:Ribosomal RNA small subunit methyltransferase H n=1 Tax=Williamsoniiplasma somnilux TaxID=215578 RepID=A0A2K8NY35_9MOLU|nr:16S rRNA (cytosine(1402)-N(4))-methyltransferase RsmH [Williamsoniiplasma somnilux]ATZ18654.1 16S rRNA (cytosine1402-N4)-methyltransferase [Williamsoniiplasma somnilux]
MEKLHVPVLLTESIKLLNIKPGGIYVDCTLGRGGHSSEILKKLSTGKLFAIDQDPTAIKEGKEVLTKISPNFEILEGNFLNISALLAIKNVFKVDGILYDLGVSSPQLDVGARGFSYRFDGPLDMRMDPINNPLTAAKVINTYHPNDLVKILKNFGDENFAEKIVENIILKRPINTTLELVDVIKSSLPQKVLKAQKHPAKKTFQALRIFVNNEIEVFKDSLEQSLELLNSKGRIVVITFHSLEEKIVKETFKKLTISPRDTVISTLPIEIESDTEFKLVIKKPVRADKTELKINNRAHSAKLWAIEKK